MCGRVELGGRVGARELDRPDSLSTRLLPPQFR